ncbi:MAG TPA: class II aldolase/adducin family protein [Thermoanaerobaculaceae bacterium]|nr:class II aldolase/adducin family protein [Thermoanaerobaculaceae bacterium]
MAEWTEARRRAELVAVGAALAREGLVRGREGNLSCRLDDARVLLTPKGADKGRLSARELICCGVDGPPPAGASSEALLHLEVYRRCPEVAALVHAHPGQVLALDARGALPDGSGLKEAALVLKRIARVPVLPPGSRELAVACAEALRRAPVAVMARHGAVAAGRDAWEALERVEVLELVAAITLARRNGSPG